MPSSPGARTRFEQLGTQLDRLLPPIHIDDPLDAMVERWLGRLTVALGWSGVACPLTIAGYTLALSYFLTALVSLSAAFTLAAPLVAYKRGLSRHATVQALFGLTFLAQLSAAAVTGGVRSWAAPALILFPLGIVFQVGIRAATRWLLVAVVAYAGLYYAEELFGPLPGPGVVQTNFLYAINLIILACYTFAIGALHAAIAQVHRDHLDRARREARAANHAKTAFLANMSHELRTPMNGIVGLTEQMAAGHTPKSAETLAMVARSGRQMVALLDDLLDLSRVEAGRTSIETAPLSLADLLSELAGLLQNQAAKQAVELVIQVEPDVGCGDSDTVRLRQILLNLMGNAVKFTENGTVTVEAHRAGEAAIIRVTDTGIGIPGDALERIFHPFEQVDPSTRRRWGGSGLGLAISRRLAVALGGQLTATSTVGKCSTFTLELPFPQVDTPEAPLRRAVCPPAAYRGPRACGRRQPRQPTGGGPAARGPGPAAHLDRRRAGHHRRRAEGGARGRVHGPPHAHL
jgi:signal transduction histidine kinase